VVGAREGLVFEGKIPGLLGNEVEAVELEHLHLVGFEAQEVSRVRAPLCPEYFLWRLVGGDWQQLVLDEQQHREAVRLEDKQGGLWGLVADAEGRAFEGADG